MRPPSPAARCPPRRGRCCRQSIDARGARDRPRRPGRPRARRRVARRRRRRRRALASPPVAGRAVAAGGGAAVGLAATALFRAFPLAPPRLPVRTRRLGRLLLLLFGLGVRRGRRLLCASTAAAATAATSGLGSAATTRFLSRRDGGLRCYVLRCFDGSGSLDRRLLSTLLSASKPAQAKSPSCARAAATPA